ncbi:Endonuclease/exonuclease/phosphatase [Parasponia andersonii]|uniref:Endonuclease/exonuclease/phosphatase n=1 Tax=Parasponia andersonii TaxID=3476 RepID=A0A2P5CFG9_PARAD|nr:Endonuclease/exonuclease/phosphatase [Parasponia andersonii]
MRIADGFFPNSNDGLVNIERLEKKRDPWLVMGDFNEILSQRDKSGSSYVLSIERLGWAMINQHWLPCNKNIELEHLDFYNSDHRALLVTIQDQMDAQNIFTSVGENNEALEQVLATIDSSVTDSMNSKLICPFVADEV